MSKSAFQPADLGPVDDGLASQMRRAAPAIPANIAAGYGKNSEAERASYMQISMSSASEIAYHLLLAHDLGYLNTADYDVLNSRVVEVKRMLAGSA